MDSGTQTLDAAAILAAARRARTAENDAAATVLAAAVEWALAHQVTDLDDAATWLVGPGRDPGIPIAGEGAPLVSEFAVAELATALGLSAASGRRLVSEALELACRLPRLWARVQAGSLPAWRARRIAEHTLSLCPEAATYVDVQLAPFAHRVGVAQTERLVDEAIARHMPEVAAEIRERAAEARHCDVDLDQISFAGTARVDAELDLVDALDLEDVVAAGAAEQAALGSTESLDVRRAKAIGDLARRQLALGFQTEAETGEKTAVGAVPLEGAEVSTSSTSGGVSTGSTSGGAGRFGRHRSRGREVVLHAHLSADALRSGDRDSDVPVWVTGAGGWAGGQLLTAAQVAQWCGLPDTTRVTVKPVVDLNTVKTVDGYRVPDWLAEQARLRTGRVCSRSAPARPGPATSTTSSPSTKAGRRRVTTWPACAGCTTG